MPSMNTKLRTLENCELIACTRCSVNRAKEATEPEMSAMTKISGLAGCGGLKRRAIRAAPATTREANGEFATQWAKRALQLGHLVAIGVHDVQVLGQGLTHRFGQRF